VLGCVQFEELEWSWWIGVGGLSSSSAQLTVTLFVFPPCSLRRAAYNPNEREVAASFKVRIRNAKNQSTSAARAFVCVFGG
jgi:hypothetical protein